MRTKKPHATAALTTTVVICSLTIVGCAPTHTQYTTQRTHTATVTRIYESPLGYHLDRIDTPGAGSIYISPLYRSPVSNSTVYRVRTTETAPNE
ncbi:MAG: hypothetical protein EA380_00605 [Phycisphaeraceae bacterium]|nr:MAG: hypothetical protein EA380_00605 [Phycisphaeraceae bacterium]